MAVSNIFGALGICFQSSLILGKEMACCLKSVCNNSVLQFQMWCFFFFFFPLRTTNGEGGFNAPNIKNWAVSPTRLLVSC